MALCWRARPDLSGRPETLAPILLTAQGQQRAGALRDAVAILDAIRARRKQASNPTTPGSLYADRFAIVVTLSLPAIALMVLILARSQVFKFWQYCIDFWFLQMALPFQTALEANGGLNFIWNGTGTDLPGMRLRLVTAVVLAALVTATFFYPRTRRPLLHVMRMLCIIQALALLLFSFAPAQLPHNLTEHLHDMAGIGYLLLLAVPLILSIGYCQLQLSLPKQIRHTALVIGYFLILLPHQIVLHAVIVQQGTWLLMPLLYLGLGPVLDVVLLIALCSGVVSCSQVDPEILGT